MTRTFRIIATTMLIAVTAGSYLLTNALGLTPPAAEPGGAVPRPETPRFGTERMSATTDDPADAQAGRWALRLYQTEIGDTCVQEGQVVGGRYGRQLATRFVERNLEDAGVCAPSTAGSWASTTRHLDDPRTQAEEPPRTVVFGLIEEGSTGPVLLEHNGRTLRLVVNADGAFLHVLPGTPADRTLNITVPKRGGATKTFQL